MNVAFWKNSTNRVNDFWLGILIFGIMFCCVTFICNIFICDFVRDLKYHFRIQLF